MSGASQGCGTRALAEDLDRANVARNRNRAPGWLFSGAVRAAVFDGNLGFDGVIPEGHLAHLRFN